MVCVDGDAAFLGLEIGRACVERVHHDGVLVQLLVLVVDDDNALAVERPADAAVGAETAAVFVKMVADTACGAVAVVGHRLDDDSNAAGAVALVGDGFVVVAAAGCRCFFQHALDVVVRHIGGLAQMRLWRNW